MAPNVVALFDTDSEAQAAVRRLIDAGVSPSEISVVSQSDRSPVDPQVLETDNNLSHEGATSGLTSGALVGGTVGLIAGIGLGAAVPFLGFLVAGPIVGLLTGTVTGAATGGMLGGLIGLGMPKEEAETYAQRMEAGGILVVESADAVRLGQILRNTGVREEPTDTTSSYTDDYAPTRPYRNDDHNTPIPEDEGKRGYLS